MINFSFYAPVKSLPEERLPLEGILLLTKRKYYLDRFLVCIVCILVTQLGTLTGSAMWYNS